MTRGTQLKNNYECEVFTNGKCVFEKKQFTTLKEIAKELEMSYYQICDFYEGRIAKKYQSKYMPKILITAIEVF